ncbi:MAG: DUF6455 family protein [Pseudomonadota bacterium]
MPRHENLRLHAGLVDDMAAMLDIDLQDAAIRGQVSIDQIAEAVIRCTGCPDPDYCQSVLQRAAPHEGAPEYCRNQDLLKKLMP